MLITIGGCNTLCWCRSCGRSWMVKNPPPVIRQGRICPCNWEEYIKISFIWLILCWSSLGHCSRIYFRLKLHICKDFYIISIVLWYLHFSSSLHAKLLVWRANMHDCIATCNPIFNESETVAQHSKILSKSVLCIYRYSVCLYSIDLLFS